MPRPNVPPAELDVIACLHRHGEATAAQLREAMQSYRPMSHGAMVTLLKRLEAKNLVCRKKGPVGKAFVYSVAQRRGPTFRNVVRDLVQRIFHGDGAALVASLFETKPPTTEEVEKIQQLLNDLREKTPKEGGKKS
ncbi:MAG: BlaI/MecI/CopY family transcriptional regulator [Verrucomicrobia bacterium]|nr:BlaI/MecI/CopY family transcriptional regulator [Verrucomicrobiota bacterium]